MAGKPIRRRCREARVGLAELHQGSRRLRIAAVRGALAVQLVTQVGLSLADAARQLGVSTSGVAQVVARAEQTHVHKVNNAFPSRISGVSMDSP